MNEFDNIEEIIRKKLENHTANVKPELWQNIKSKLPHTPNMPVQVASVTKMLAVKIIAAVAVVTGIAVGGYFILNNNHKQNQTAQVENSNIKSEKAQPEPATKIIETTPPVIEKTVKKPANNLQHSTTKNNKGKTKTIPQTKATPVNTQQSTNTLPVTKNEAPVTPQSPATQKPQNNLPEKQNTQPKKAKQKPTKIAIVVSKFDDFGGYSIIYSCTTNAPYVSWNFGDGSPDMNQNKGTHDYANPGTYTVTATVYDANGKQANQASKQITFEEKAAIIFVPNIITPNGDGLNDVFKIKVLDIQSLSVKIFQKGKMVYEAENADADNLWNGKDMSGNDLPSGQYQYAIYAVDKNGKSLSPKVGNLTVRR